MKKLPEFPDKHAGEVTQFDWTKTDMVWSCCSCCRVHRWRFAVHGKILRIKAWDMSNLTKKLRERKKKESSR